MDILEQQVICAVAVRRVEGQRSIGTAVYSVVAARPASRASISSGCCWRDSERYAAVVLLLQLQACLFGGKSLSGAVPRAGQGPDDAAEPVSDPRGAAGAAVMKPALSSVSYSSAHTGRTFVLPGDEYSLTFHRWALLGERGRMPFFKSLVRR
ncbi:MAG: hypothetical protein AMJ93_16805 [Anaerolineae bacterium SM23_84]|nr:MAG: hypothetical protein AMJ93_16805 [Anaerolineae bacterium SM23_84]